MSKNEKKLLKIFLTLVVLYAVQLVYLHFANIIIKVDGRNITKAQFDKVFEKNANTSGFLAVGVDIKKDKKNFLYLMIKDKAVEDLIKQTLIEEEIEKKHITADEKEVNDELQKIIEKIGSKENFNQMLKQNDVSLKQFKENLKDELKKKKLAQSVSKIVIPDTEAKKYYDQNLNSFKREATANVSHIFIAANPIQIEQIIKSAPESQKLSDKEIKAKVKQEQGLKLEKAKSLLSVLKNDPAAFEKLAKDNSESEISAKNGGKVGFINKSQMPDAIAKVVFSIKLNEISEIIKTPYGYQIIKVSERTKAGFEPFDKVKNDIIATLEKQKQDKNLEDFANSLKKQAKVEYVNRDYMPKSVEERYNESGKSKN